MTDMSNAEFIRDLAARMFRNATPAMGFDQGDTDRLYVIANRLAALEQAGEPESFQQHVQPWMMECFGETISGDMLERADRFTEEALELAQTMPGFSAERAHALVDYVFGRDVGERKQEVGGVMVTLAALCLAAGEDMHDAGENELARISQPHIVEKIRAKQAAKPTGSALPVASPMTEIQRLGQEFDAGEDELERIAAAIHESDPDVGCSWAEWVAYAEAHPDHLQSVDYTRRQARAVADIKRPEPPTAFTLLRHYHDAINARNDCAECENEGPWEHCGPCSERIGPVIAAQINFLAHPPQSRVAADPVGLREAVRLGLEDAEYLDRISEDADENNWQDWGAAMRQAAIRLRDLAALATPSQPDPQSRGQAFDGEGEARADDIRRSIIRQLGDDPHADRIILPGTDWDIVLATLSSAKRGEKG